MADAQIQLTPVPVNLLYMMVGKLPDIAVKEINEHIDNVVIPNKVDSSNNLVGQISQDKKSSQLNFSLETAYGKKFKEMLDGCATSLLQNVGLYIVMLEITIHFIVMALLHLLGYLVYYI